VIGNMANDIKLNISPVGLLFCDKKIDDPGIFNIQIQDRFPRAMIHLKRLQSFQLKVFQIIHCINILPFGS